MWLYALNLLLVMKTVLLLELRTRMRGNICLTLTYLHFFFSFFRIFLGGLTITFGNVVFHSDSLWAHLMEDSLQLRRKNLQKLIFEPHISYKAAVNQSQTSSRTSGDFSLACSLYNTNIVVSFRMQISISVNKNSSHMLLKCKVMQMKMLENVRAVYIYYIYFII